MREINFIYKVNSSLGVTFWTNKFLSSRRNRAKKDLASQI